MSRDIKELQELMAQKATGGLEGEAERTICICCKHRVARKNDVFCSRCSVATLQAKLQTPLPDSTIPVAAQVSAPEDVARISEPRIDPVMGKVYNRKEVARMLGVSHTSIYRWEVKGKIPQPKRFIHTQECFYTDEHVELIKAFISANFDERMANVGRAQERGPRPERAINHTPECASMAATLVGFVTPECDCQHAPVVHEHQPKVRNLSRKLEKSVARGLSRRGFKPGRLI